MGEKVNVLIEVRKPRQVEGFSLLKFESLNFGNIESMQMDEQFEPISMEKSNGFSMDTDSIVVRASIDIDEISKLKDQENVINVWNDTKIEPFQSNSMILNQKNTLSCPFPSCDCSPAIAKGDIYSVANKLDVEKLWNKGYNGEGIVIGIVDGGISAKNRVKDGKIDRVIGGYPKSNWGTIAGWSEHGNMSATDAQGMAPKSNIYDIRISDGSFISSALSGFQWAIDQFKKNGTPQILSNSWGIYQKNWDSQYATDPNHIFTRKVTEAVSLGIVVLFAAGNCGDNCPDNRCGADIGSSNSIWGANGHSSVITVGAVNELLEYIGYSSVGPAALDNKKPDICGISHFKGYFNPDTGTSAACPIVSGVVALLKQSVPNSGPLEIKNAINKTAIQLAGNRGWNEYSGHGVINASKAHNWLKNNVISNIT